MTRWTATLIAASSVLMAGPAVLANEPSGASPVGLWKTIDDKTGKERSLVRIQDQGGQLTGRIERLLAPDANQEAVCDKCSDDRKDQRILGMEIVRGVQRGDGGVWDGGTILDPNEGKVYRVRLTPVEGGQRLQVRGYVGAPLLGRTQTWVRAD